MKNWLYRIALLFTLSSVVLLNACSFDPCWSKKIYLKNYDNFMDKIESKGENFGETEWEKMDEKYESFSTKCKEKFWKEMTREEKDRVIENNMKYLMLRVKSKFSGSLFKNLETKVNSFFKDIDKEKLNAFSEDLSETWEDIRKHNADDLDKALSELGKAIEDVGKKIGESTAFSASKNK